MDRSMGLERMMMFRRDIMKKIKNYHPEGGLDTATIVMLSLMSFNHAPIRVHTENVALMAEAVALRMKKDARAAFFAGLMHDAGKMILPSCLLDGRNITDAEYAEVKKEAIITYQVRKKTHLFVAYCAGFHHALYEKGQGLTSQDFPSVWQPQIVEEILEIATIVAICDYVEDFSNNDELGISLEESLKMAFPNELKIVQVVLEEAGRMHYEY